MLLPVGVIWNVAFLVIPAHLLVYRGLKCLHPRVVALNLDFYAPIVGSNFLTFAPSFFLEKKKKTQNNPYLRRS